MHDFGHFEKENISIPNKILSRLSTKYEYFFVLYEPIQDLGVLFHDCLERNHADFKNHSIV